MKAIRVWASAIGLAVAVGAAGMTLAQAVEKEVTVMARRVVRTAVGSAVPMEEVIVQRRVSYADLDLATDTGVAELDKRIRDTAKAACDEIVVKAPASTSDDSACVKRAIDEAMAEAAKVIGERRGAAPAR